MRGELATAGEGGAVITLEVIGTPAPKGSARAMLIGGKARLVAGSSNANNTAQDRWCRAVREVALAQSDSFADTALVITIEFRMPRIKGHFGSGRNAGKLRPAAPTEHATKPDIDKLVRCTLDALVTTKRRGKVHHGIIDDDARIVELVASKTYSDHPGATIQIMTRAERDA